MEVGKAYIIHCGDWHSYVGRIAAQVRPYTYRMESCSKIHDTHNGDNWESLAAGDEAARRAAEYRHYRTPVLVTLNIAAIEWAGKTPQEANP